MKKDALFIRFLYGTAIGRCVLKLLVQPWISEAVGLYLRSRLSHWLIDIYIRRNAIDMRGYPDQQYRSFNDFFTRKRENAPDAALSDLISPCDAYLTIHPIDSNCIYHIKHTDYSLDQLLDNSALAGEFAGGICLMFRLTPQNYHRYCYVCSGTIEQTRRIAGCLHCVRPIAYNRIPVFTQNTREYTVIRSPELGRVVQMEIGALLVGRIKNHLFVGSAAKGSEKGFFEFGGSTIIVLLKKNTVTPDAAISENSRCGVETQVCLGMKIGEILSDEYITQPDQPLDSAIRKASSDCRGPL